MAGTLAISLTARAFRRSSFRAFPADLPDRTASSIPYSRASNCTECFYIFDFCDNFAFFRENPKGKDAVLQQSLQERVFNLKAQILLKLQGPEFGSQELTAFRRELSEGMAGQVAALDRSGFAVRLHLREVERFSPS